jgi:hypothetical protein
MDAQNGLATFEGALIRSYFDMSNLPGGKRGCIRIGGGSQLHYVNERGGPSAGRVLSEYAVMRELFVSHSA